VLYHVCTGREPFPGTTTLAQLTALAVDEPEPVDAINPAIPPALADLVARLLAKDPADRPESADAVRDRLDELARQTARSAGSSKTQVLVSAGRPPKRARKRVPVIHRRRSLLVGVLIAAAVGVAGLGLVAAAGVTWLLLAPAPHEVPPAATFVSDLPEVDREHYPPKMPPAGGVLRVHRKATPHGLFLHPPPIPGAACSVSFRLGGQFDAFHTLVAINDGLPHPAESPCTFTISGDGKTLWQSRPLRTPADAQECNVSVRGVDVLRIAVTCDGPPRGAHAVCVEPHLTK
jgi:hypothetical protein